MAGKSVFFCYAHSFIHSTNSAAKITLEIELICFDEEWNGQRRRTHFHSNRNEYVGRIKTQELSSISVASEECAAEKIESMMMMMRTAAAAMTKKKQNEKEEKRNPKVVFCCVEREFNEFANFVRSGNVSNVV